MEVKNYGIEDLGCLKFGTQGTEFDMQTFRNFQKETGGFPFPHRHDYYLLFLATEGKGAHLIDFEYHEIRSGMLFLMYPGMIHEWKDDQKLDGFLISSQQISSPNATTTTSFSTFLSFPFPMEILWFDSGVNPTRN